MAKPFTKLLQKVIMLCHLITISLQGMNMQKFKKGPKFGLERSYELSSTDNEQGTCLQLQRLTRNPPKCNLVDKRSAGL